MSYDQPNLFTYCVARNICVSSHYYHQKKKKIKTKQNQQKYIIQNKEISYVSCVEKNNKNHKPNTE